MSNKKQLQLLLEDEKYEALEELRDDYLSGVYQYNTIGATSDETLKLTYMREGKIMAIKEFFNLLEQEIH